MGKRTNVCRPAGKNMSRLARNKNFMLILSVCLLKFFPSCQNRQQIPVEQSHSQHWIKIPDAALTHTDSQGKTLVHHAASDGDKDLISYLLSKGCGLDQKDHTGLTPLHEAVQNKNTSMIRFLLKQKANIHAKTDDLNTPLHLAVFNHDIQSAEILYFNGAHCDVSAGNKDDISPLNHALSQNDLIMAELLYRPMHYIIKKDKVEYFVYLIRNKKETVFQTDRRKMTPLHVAYLLQRQDFIEDLIKCGADASFPDIYGNKPKYYAGMDFMEPSDGKSPDRRYGHQGR